MKDKQDLILVAFVLIFVMWGINEHLTHMEMISKSMHTLSHIEKMKMAKDIERSRADAQNF